MGSGAKNVGRCEAPGPASPDAEAHRPRRPRYAVMGEAMASGDSLGVQLGAAAGRAGVDVGLVLRVYCDTRCPGGFPGTRARLIGPERPTPRARREALGSGHAAFSSSTWPKPRSRSSWKSIVPFPSWPALMLVLVFIVLSFVSAVSAVTIGARENSRAPCSSAMNLVCLQILMGSRFAPSGRAGADVGLSASVTGRAAPRAPHHAP